MPFDFTGSHAVPFSEPSTPEIKIIDGALALLGPHGERWIKGSLARRGRHCLFGALTYAAHDLHLSHVRQAVALRIAAALPVGPGSPDPATAIARYNDEPSRRFDEIKDVLLRARRRAVADALAHRAQESALVPA